jgi:UDP-N-acetyl-2-amino-2-deoxyglucuronate dehydrogenase
MRRAVAPPFERNVSDVLKERAKALAESAIERALVAAGYEGVTLDRANLDAREVLRTRVRAARARRGIVSGQAVVFTGPGELGLRPVERILAGPAQVTVETLVTAVSPGTERAQWLRLPNAQPHFPYTPGYSGVGRVLAGGNEAMPVGSLVAIARLPHASVATVPASWATPVPDGVEPREAALVYLAIIAGYGVQRAGDVSGRRVCVVGAGTIGALALRMARLSAPSETIVVATSRAREEATLERGAGRFEVVAGAGAGAGAGGIDADVVIEATGDPQALRTAVSAAADGATIVLLGSSRGTTDAVPIAELQRRNLRMIGAHISCLATEAKRLDHDPFQAIASRFVGALATGDLRADDLVGDATDPRELGALYHRLADGTARAGYVDWACIPRDERVRVGSVLASPSLLPAHARVDATPAPAAPATGSLRFAVIGCGDIGGSNAKAVAAAGNAELTLSYDPVPELAAATAAKRGGSVAGSLEEAFDPSNVDAVLLSVPHDLHAPLVQRAAEAGLHVIVEKPLAVDLPSARSAIDAAAAAGVTLSVCFPFRYEPELRTARALVEAGALGEMRGSSLVFHADKADAYWLGGYSGRASSDWRQKKDRSGGGVLLMNMTHYIDFMRAIGGLEPQRVTAVARGDAGAEVEDAIAVTVEFAGGAIGSLVGSGSTRGRPENRFDLWGEHGSLRLEPDPAVFTTRAIDGVVPGRWCTLTSESDSSPRAVFVERFVDAVLTGREPDVTVADGFAVQAFVDAAYRSMAQGGAPVTIEELDR